MVGLLLEAAAALGRCSVTTLIRNADFSKVRTTNGEIKDAAKVNDRPKTDHRDVDAPMATKGLDQTSDDSANLYIGYSGRKWLRKNSYLLAATGDMVGGWYPAGGHGGDGAE